MSTNGTNGINGHAVPHVNGNGHPHPVRRFDMPPPDDVVLPPHNLDAERGALGGMLFDNDQVPGVLAILSDEDFYRDSHQTIFRAIKATWERLKRVDLVLLCDELERRGELDKVGGLDLPAELLGSLPHALNTIHHAQIVKEKAVRREGIQTLNRALKTLYSNDLTAARIVQSVRVRMDRLSRLCIEGMDEPRVNTVCLADVVSAPVEWFWPQRFPLGMLSLLVGDPSVGKSFITLGMATASSLGACWPDSQGECAPLGSTILLSAEDALANTIRPRLDAMGADVRKIHALTTVRGADGKLGPFRLGVDLPLLEKRLDDIPDCRLLVIDPVSAYLSGADEHKNAEVRGMISPLSELAERRNLAVVLVTHLNKGTGSKALYRATGSLAFVAASRMAWLVVRDKENPARQLVLPVKHNITEKPAGLAYQIQDGIIQWDPTPITVDANEALAPDGGGGGGLGIGTKVEQAEAFLRFAFASGEERTSESVLTAGEIFGLKRDPLFAAKKTLGIKARKSTEADGSWVWYLPTDPTVRHFDGDDGTIDWTNT